VNGWIAALWRFSLRKSPQRVILGAFPTVILRTTKEGGLQPLPTGRQAHLTGGQGRIPRNAIDGQLLLKAEGSFGLKSSG